MKANIKWTGDVSFTGTADSGHTVIMDGAPESGGQNKGSRPMELVLIGMGGCTAYDVVHILRKSRQEITDCVAEIEAKRAETDPKVFTQHSHPFYRHRKEPGREKGPACHRTVGHQVLFRLDHDRQDRQDHA